VGRGQRQRQGARPGGAAEDARHLHPHRRCPALGRRLRAGEDKLRTLYPGSVRIAIICDNFSPHLTTRRGGRVGAWAAVSNVEIACTPTNSSWSNRIEAQFTALRLFAPDGTDHATHAEQASMIRRYITYQNNHAYNERLRRIIDKATLPDTAL
jgi:hypothetical protein